LTEGRVVIFARGNSIPLWVVDRLEAFICLRRFIVVGGIFCPDGKREKQHKKENVECGH
jgi:hypothetical protein